MAPTIAIAVDLASQAEAVRACIATVEASMATVTSRAVAVTTRAHPFELVYMS